MKRLVVIFAFLLVLSAMAFAQEPPEPTVVTITCEGAEDFQVKWFNGDWTFVTPTTFEFFDGIATTTHKFFSGLGSITFEAVSPDSTSGAERFVRFDMPVLAVPDYPLPGDTRWWGIYRVRWRCRVQANGYISDPYNWSPQSWWVIVIGAFIAAVPVNAP